MNEGNTISGAGQIGGGSAMNLINRSLIDATGTNALIFDIASGTATNGVHGVLEGSGAGGLSITGRDDHKLGRDHRAPMGVASLSAHLST